MYRTGLRIRGRVWDPLVRLFHWGLATAFAVAWLNQSESTIHETAGQIVLGLLIFRLAWGIVGPASARFETFITGPFAAFRYMRDILTGRPAHFLGHNPAGAAMIVALMASLATTAVSGLLMTTTALWGGTWVEWIHGTAAYISLWLIGGHLLGVLLASFQHRENLPLAMLTGRKWSEMDFWPYLGPPAFYAARVLGAASLVAILAFAWWGTLKVLNGSFWRMPKIIAAAAKEQQCGKVTISGPRLEVYPAMMVRYAVTSETNPQTVETGIPLSVALKPRPSVMELNLPRYCNGDTASVAGDVAPHPVLETDVAPQPQTLAIAEPAEGLGRPVQPRTDAPLAGNAAASPSEQKADRAASQASTSQMSTPPKERQKRKRKRKRGKE